MDSARSLIFARPVDDKDVAKNAKSDSKVKNDKRGGAIADGVDLESGSDWCYPHPTISICGSQKCQMDMFVKSVQSLSSKLVKLKTYG